MGSDEAVEDLLHRARQSGIRMQTSNGSVELEGSFARGRVKGCSWAADAGDAEPCRSAARVDGRAPAFDHPAEQPHVLIVEDDAELLEVTAALLECHGYDIEVARDGMEAVVAIRRRPPDVVLLDIELPGLDGYQICQLLKHGAEYEATRVVMVSARSPIRERRRGFLAGADAYLAKPYEAEQLRAIIRNTLDAPRTRASFA